MLWIVLWISVLCPHPLWAKDAADYVRLLGDPAKADPRRDEVDALVRAYAPKIIFHPKDKYGAMDPLKFIEASSLWKRRSIFASKLIAARGTVDAKTMIQTDTEDYYLKYEDEVETPAASPVIKTSYAEKPVRAPQTPPVLWRLGTSQAIEHLGSPRPGRSRVLIEYWYHSSYSYASPTGLGNHQGDWEGLAMLVDLGVSETGKLAHELVAAFYAQHSGGKWYCPYELQWNDAHPEAFSALGTHATYPKAGVFRTTFITDKTARGQELNAWKNLRPLVLEPYYGYQGRWGDVHLFSFMSGPRVPDPFSKALPPRNSSAAFPRCGWAVTVQN